MRIYRDLSGWYRLLTPASNYVEEAAHIAAMIEAICEGPAATVLELGSGAGHNASHLKARFACTLSDISPEMLDLSRALNPDCEHLLGDMRSLRLGRQFDAVFIHDAVDYMTSRADLRAAIGTAAMHLRPGGAAIFMPDELKDDFRPRTEHGGHDGEDGRAMRYLMWTFDPDPTDTVCTAEFALLLREPGQPVRCERDSHEIGLFDRATWRRLMDEAGLEPVPMPVPDPHKGEHAVFTARKR